MGGMCGKPLAIEDNQESLNGKVSNADFRNSGSDFRNSRVNSRRIEERVHKKDGTDSRISLIDEKVIGSKKVYDDQIEKKRRDSYSGNIGRVPKAVEGEQVAAGWPSWLSIAAGEAIQGWIPRRADTFEKLDKIGQGTYSHVYKARDIISGKIVALKKVRFDTDPDSVNFMAREILILRRLDHPNIIKLEGLITSKMSCSLYLVFEYMEHDLTGLTSLPGIKFTEPQVKCYMNQLLSGLDHCHSRGVLHRDIKCSNLLIDDNGILKIADFGLASFFDPLHNVAMTSRVVTLWYRPPELLLGSTHYGVSVDLWSAGCILGELFAHKPIMPGRTEVEQLHKIFRLCGSPSEEYWRKSKLPHAAVFKPQQPYKRYVAETFKNFPSTAVALLETLLSIDPAYRGTASHALKSEFFTAEPHAVDPSRLPKYPPSKEIDAKLRDEEAKRQKSNRKEKTEKTRAAPASNANAELISSMRNHSNSKTRSEIFNSRNNEAAYGFPIDPPRHSQAASNGFSTDLSDHHKRDFHSGPLGKGPPPGWAKSGKKVDDPSDAPSRADLSTFSGVVCSRTMGSGDQREKSGSSSLWSSTKQDQKRHAQKMSDIRQMEDYRAHANQSNMHDYDRHGSDGRNNTFSGPLLVSSNVDQRLKDHERKIQESVRRARIGKAKGHGK